MDLGVTVAIAAGNSGPGYSTVGSPGVARKPISVAATDKDDQIAWFSSRGPIPGEWNIKPDLAAPGVSILAPVPALGVLGDPSRYLHLSGTSMATPHVAGAAALLLQLHPEWTPDNVKSALANTSLDLGYDAYTQGAGRIQLLPAANTSAVATPSSLGFGLDDLTLDLWEVSETLTFSNLSDSAVTYTVALESDLPAGVTITADRSSVVLGPGESAEVIVGLSVDNTVVPNPPEQPFSYEGAVVATSEDETLRVPFSFIKSPVINFTFDENPWIVLESSEEYGTEYLEILRDKVAAAAAP